MKGKNMETNDVNELLAYFTNYISAVNDMVFEIVNSDIQDKKDVLKIIKKHLSNALDTNGINEVCNKYLNKEIKNE